MATALVYFVGQVALGSVPELNFWGERRRHLNSENNPNEAMRVARLPVNPNLINPGQILENLKRRSIDTHLPLALTESSGIQLKTSSINSRQAAILKALSPLYGTVRKAPLFENVPKDSRVIIHIQDVHLNQEAQKNISKTIQELINQNQVDLVALEGAFGSIDLERFRKYPHQDVIRMIADYLRRENKISGPAYTAFTSPKEIPPVVGVDDRKHYDANVEAYRNSARLIASSKKQLASLQAMLASDKSKNFNPKLKDYDSRVEAYHKGVTSIGDYLQFLESSVSKPMSPATQTFLEAFKLESSLNFNQVERERTRIIEQLVSKLTSDQMSALVNHSLAYRMGSLGHADFYEYLQKLCEASGVKLSNFKAMNDYIQYVILSDGIDAEKLFGEMSAREEDGYRSFTETSKEEALIKESKQLRLTTKLLDFSLTREEWEDYQKLSPSNIDLKPYETFYKEAQFRDDAMAQNLLKAIQAHDAKVAVLVTGGFHSKGIDQQLYKAGLTTITFTPKITRVDSSEGSAYLSVFTQEKTPLEKLFAGEKLFLTPEVFPGPIINGGVPATLALGIKQAQTSQLIPETAQRTIFDPLLPHILQDKVRASAKPNGRNASQVEVTTPDGVDAEVVSLDQTKSIIESVRAIGTYKSVVFSVKSFLLTGFTFEALYLIGTKLTLPQFGILFLIYFAALLFIDKNGPLQWPFVVRVVEMATPLGPSIPLMYFEWRGWLSKPMLMVGTLNDGWSEHVTPLTDNGFEDLGNGYFINRANGWLIRIDLGLGQEITVKDFYRLESQVQPAAEIHTVIDRWKFVNPPVAKAPPTFEKVAQGLYRIHADYLVLTRSVWQIQHLPTSHWFLNQNTKDAEPSVGVLVGKAKMHRKNPTFVAVHHEQTPRLVFKIGLLLFDAISGDPIDWNSEEEFDMPLTEEQSYQVVEESGFKVGGVNSSDLIRKIQTLNGKSIEDLNRSGKRYPNMTPMLGEGDDLRELLIRDNDYVLSRGLTHQDVAAPLFYVFNLWSFVYKSSSLGAVKPLSFRYRGQQFSIDLRSYSLGTVGSLFSDGTSSRAYDLELTNDQTGRKMRFSALHPYMISRWGFYEGGKDYRLDPADIISMFSLSTDSPGVQRAAPAQAASTRRLWQTVGRKIFGDNVRAETGFTVFWEGVRLAAPWTALFFADVWNSPILLGVVFALQLFNYVLFWAEHKITTRRQLGVLILLTLGYPTSILLPVLVNPGLLIMIILLLIEHYRHDNKIIIGDPFDRRFNAILSQLPARISGTNLSSIQRAYRLAKIMYARDNRKIKHVLDLVEVSVEKLLSQSDIHDPQEVSDYLSGCLLHDVLEDWDEGNWGKAKLKERPNDYSVIRAEAENLILSQTNQRVLDMVRGLTNQSAWKKSSPGEEERSLESDMETDRIMLQLSSTGESARTKLFVHLAKTADRRSNLGDFFDSWCGQTWKHITPQFVGNRVPWELTRSMRMIQESDVLPEAVKSDYLQFLFSLVVKHPMTADLFSQMSEHPNVIQAGIDFFNAMSTRFTTEAQTAVDRASLKTLRALKQRLAEEVKAGESDLVVEFMRGLPAYFMGMTPNQIVQAIPGLEQKIYSRIEELEQKERIFAVETTGSMILAASAPTLRALKHAFEGDIQADEIPTRDAFLASLPDYFRGFNLRKLEAHIPGLFDKISVRLAALESGPSGAPSNSVAYWIAKALGAEERRAKKIGKFGLLVEIPLLILHGVAFDPMGSLIALSIFTFVIHWPLEVIAARRHNKAPPTAIQIVKQFLVFMPYFILTIPFVQHSPLLMAFVALLATANHIRYDFKIFKEQKLVEEIDRLLSKASTDEWTDADLERAEFLADKVIKGRTLPGHAEEALRLLIQLKKMFIDFERKLNPSVTDIENLLTQPRWSMSEWNTVRDYVNRQRREGQTEAIPRFEVALESHLDDLTGAPDLVPWNLNESEVLDAAARWEAAPSDDNQPRVVWKSESPSDTPTLFQLVSYRGHLIFMIGARHSTPYTIQASQFAAQLAKHSPDKFSLFIEEVMGEDNVRQPPYPPDCWILHRRAAELNLPVQRGVGYLSGKVVKTLIQQRPQDAAKIMTLALMMAMMQANASVSFAEGVPVEYLEREAKEISRELGLSEEAIALNVMRFVTEHWINLTPEQHRDEIAKELSALIAHSNIVEWALCQQFLGAIPERPFVLWYTGIEHTGFNESDLLDFLRLEGAAEFVTQTAWLPLLTYLKKFAEDATSNEETPGAGQSAPNKEIKNAPRRTWNWTSVLFSVMGAGALGFITLWQLTAPLHLSGSRKNTSVAKEAVPSLNPTEIQKLDLSEITSYLNSISFRANQLGISEGNRKEFDLIHLSQARDLLEKVQNGDRKQVPVAVIDLSPEGTSIDVLKKNMPLDQHGLFMANIVDQVAGSRADIWSISAGIKTKKGDLEITQLAEAVRYATTQGAKVIVISLSNDGRTETIKAIDEALDKGITVAIAVGNDGVQDTAMLPSHDKRILMVGSVLNNGNRAPESNYGVTMEGMKVVDIFAPGRLYVTLPNGERNLAVGTSFSSPVVGGVVALLLSMNPTMSGQDVANYLEGSVSKTNDLPILDASAAVQKVIAKDQKQAMRKTAAAVVALALGFSQSESNAAVFVNSILPGHPTLNRHISTINGRVDGLTGFMRQMDSHPEVDQDEFFSIVAAEVEKTIKQKSLTLPEARQLVQKLAEFGLPVHTLDFVVEGLSQEKHIAVVTTGRENAGQVEKLLDKATADRPITILVDEEDAEFYRDLKSRSKLRDKANIRIVVRRPGLVKDGTILLSDLEGSLPMDTNFRLANTLLIVPDGITIDPTGINDESLQALTVLFLSQFLSGVLMRGTDIKNLDKLARVIAQQA